MAFTVVLEGGAPWGLRLQGGRDFNEPIRVAKINPNSKANQSGIQIGDYIESINNDKTQGLSHVEALELIRNAKDTLSLQLNRSNKPGSHVNQTVNGDINHNTKFNGINASGDHISPQRPVTSAYSGGHTSRRVFSPTHGSGSRFAMTSPTPHTDTEADYGSPNRISARKFNLTSASPGPSSPALQQRSQAVFNVQSPPQQRKRPGTPGGSHRHPGLKAFFRPPVLHEGLQTSTLPPREAPAPSPLLQNRPKSQQSYNPPQARVGPTYIGGSAAAWNTGRSATPNSYYSPQLPRAGPATGRITPGFVNAPGYYSSPQLPRAFTYTPGSELGTRSLTGTPIPGRDTPLPGRETILSPPLMGRVTPLGSGRVSPTSGRATPTYVVSPYNRAIPSGRSTPADHPMSPPSRSKGLAIFEKQRMKHNIEISEHQNEVFYQDRVIKTESIKSPPTLRRKGGSPADPSRNDPLGHKKSATTIKLANSNNASPQLSQSPKVVRTGTPSGVWSPGRNLSLDIPDRENDKTDVFRDVPQVWSPGGSNNNGSLSPKKEFRPVKLDISSMSTRSKTPIEKDENEYYYRKLNLDVLNQQEKETSSSQPSEIPSWETPGRTTASTTVTTTTSTTSVPSSSSTNSYMSWNGTISHFSETKSGLPTSQSPMITLLQKNREGQLPKGATYIEESKTSEPVKPVRETAYVLPTNQVTITSKKKEEPSPPKVKGVGPTTDEGLPTSLRMSVDDQKDWYKKMFKNLNADDKPKDHNTYKPTYVFPDDDSVPDKEEPNPYKPSYEFPSSASEKSGLTNGTDKKFSESRSSITSPGRERASWSPPHARYRNEVYRNQPRSITDYEPGFSSIALKESKIKPQHQHNLSFDDSRLQKYLDAERKARNLAKLAKKNQQIFNPPIDKPGQFSKYTYNNADVKLKKEERPFSPDVNTKAAYKQIQKGGEIPVSGLRQPYPERKELGDVPSTPRHVSAMELRSPSSETMDRKTRDEEAARRREQMEKIYAEERRRKMEQEKIANEARRHHDIYTKEYWEELGGLNEPGEDNMIFITPTFEMTSPMQKSPIPSASERFEDALMEHERATNLKRPNSAKPTHHMRGKAKALYSFTAQNPKELSFKKGSVIYLLREIDNNWYEGEFRGQIGIFPKNYVEVMTSLETARQSAITREGHARARYNFTAATSVELPLKKGEIVQLIRRVDENWYEGRVGHRQGIIPVSYVEVIQEPDTPLMTPMSSLPNTPHTGSPSQLSPVSSVGHAPTIPEAPLSPWGVDDLDLMASYDQFFRPPSQQQQHRSPSSYSHHVANTSSSPAARHIYNQAYEIAQSGGAGDYGRRSNQPGPSGSLLNGGLLMPQIHHPNNRSSTYDNFDRTLRQQQQQHIEPKYPRFRARFRYMPQNDDELELQENDIVQVMEKCDDGWYVGTSLRTNEFGTFPGNYVEPV